MQAHLDIISTVTRAIVKLSNVDESSKNAKLYTLLNRTKPTKMFGLCSSGKKTSCGQSKPAKKSSCGKSKVKRCKPGKVTRNAFFNFLREFRVKHCEWPVTKIAVEGAKCWCKMSPCDRKKYIDMARCAPKAKRRSKKHKRGSSCGRKKSHRRPKRRCG